MRLLQLSKLLIKASLVVCIALCVSFVITFEAREEEEEEEEGRGSQVTEIAIGTLPHKPFEVDGLQQVVCGSHQPRVTLLHRSQHFLLHFLHLSHVANVRGGFAFEPMGLLELGTRTGCRISYLLFRAAQALDRLVLLRIRH